MRIPNVKVCLVRESSLAAALLRPCHQPKWGAMGREGSQTSTQHLPTMIKRQPSLVLGFSQHNLTRLINLRQYQSQALMRKGYAGAKPGRLVDIPTVI